MNNSGTKGRYYEDAIAVSESLNEVFSKECPKYIKMYRPREEREVVEHRANIFQNDFLGLPSRVAMRRGEVFNANDFAVFSKNAYENDPKKEITAYLDDIDFDDFYRNNVSKLELLDPNGCVAFLPQIEGLDEMYLSEPKQVFIPSKDVLFASSEYGLFKMPYNTTVEHIHMGKTVFENDGKVLFITSANEFAIAEEVKRITLEKGEIVYYYKVSGYDALIQSNKAWPYRNGLINNTAKVPLFLWVGDDKNIQVKDYDDQRLYHSSLNFSIPFITQYHQRCSDIEVENNQALYSVMWVRDDNSCSLSANDICNSGRLAMDYTHKGVPHLAGSVCPVCEGKSKMPHPVSGYSKMTFPSYATSRNGAKDPVPLSGVPMGSLDRDVSIVESLIGQRNELYKRVYESLEMKFEIETPLVQSGIAKRLDRTPSERWYRNEAAHIIGKLVQDAAKIITYLRYGKSFNYDKLRLDNYVPQYKIPKDFSIYDAGYASDEIADAINAGQPIGVRVSLLERYNRNQFGVDSLEHKKFLIAKLLQPAFGYQFSELGLLKADGAISNRDYMLSVRFDDVWQIVERKYGIEVYESDYERLKLYLNESLDGIEAQYNGGN